VRVLCCAAQPSPEQRNTLRAALIADEVQRMARFVQPIDADRFLVARGTLRIEVGRMLGIAPCDVPIELGAHGKPLIRGGTPHVNVSHAGDVVLIAISNDVAVGVDVEWIDEEIVESGLVETSFSPREIEQFAALPERVRVAAFFHVWATREAVIKAIGAGFSLPREAFDVCVDPEQSPSVVATRSPLPPDCHFVVVPIDVPAGHVARLAVEAPPETGVDITA
jgi:4'-phosphopantetheinyl transferase